MNKKFELTEEVKLIGDNKYAKEYELAAELAKVHMGE